MTVIPSGYWQPKPGDKFTQEEIDSITAFFILDLQRAQGELVRYKKIISAFHNKPKPSSHNPATTIKLYEKEIEISKTNLETVRKLKPTI